MDRLDIVVIPLNVERSWNALVRAAMNALNENHPAGGMGVVIWENPVRCVIILPLLSAGEEQRRFVIRVPDGEADIRRYFLPILLGERIQDWKARTGRSLIGAIWQIGPAGLVILRSSLRIDEQRVRAYTRRILRAWGPAAVFMLSNLPDFPKPDISV